MRAIIIEISKGNDFANAVLVETLDDTGTTVK